MLFNTGKKFKNTTTAITKQDLTQTEEVINTNIVTKNNDLVNNSDANFLNVDGDDVRSFRHRNRISDSIQRLDISNYGFYYRTEE